MRLGVNTQYDIVWNATGYRTTEFLGNNCKVGAFSNKLEPSELMKTADIFKLDTNSINGMKILEGSSKDPLLIAASLSHVRMSPKCQG